MVIPDPKKGEIASKYAPIDNVCVYLSEVQLSVKKWFCEKSSEEMNHEMDKLSNDADADKHGRKQIDLDRVMKAAVLLWPKEGKEEEEVEQLNAVVAIQCTLRQHRAARACIKRIRERRKKREEETLTLMFNSHDEDGNGIMEYLEFETLMKMLDPDLPSHLYGKMYADTLEIAERVNEVNRPEGSAVSTRGRANSAESINDDDDDDDDDDDEEEVPVSAEIWILAARHWGYYLSGDIWQRTGGKGHHTTTGPNDTPEAAMAELRKEISGRKSPPPPS